MTRKLVTEFVGTFFLVFTIGLTALDGTPLAPLAIAAVLTALVYMGAHISGAHYNPAVSVAIWMRGRMEAKEVAPYIGAQLVGALVASWGVYAVVGETLVIAPAEATGTLSFLLLEALFTFVLALVILNVATSKATSGNSYYGLAIGFTVLAGMHAVGGITGAAFNAAVAAGPAIVDALFGDGVAISSLWGFLVANFAGGAVAAVVFKFQNPDDV